MTKQLSMRWRLLHFVPFFLATGLLQVAATPDATAAGTERGSQPKHYTLSGVVSKGPVRGALVYVYVLARKDGLLTRKDEDDLLTRKDDVLMRKDDRLTRKDDRRALVAGPFRTDATGAWRSSGNIPHKAMESPLMIVSRGGTYRDEASGADIRLLSTDEIRTIRPVGAPIIATTPFSDLVSRISQKYARVAGANDAAIQAIEDFKAVFLFDPVNTIPPDPFSIPTGATEDQKLYAIALGGLSTLVNTNSMIEAAGLGGARKIDLVQAIVTDMTDGKLNGLDASDNVIPVPDGSGRRTMTFPALSADGLAALFDAMNTFLTAQRASGQDAWAHFSLPPVRPMIINVPGGLNVIGSLCGTMLTDDRISAFFNVSAGAQSPWWGDETVGLDRAWRIAREMMVDGRNRTFCGLSASPDTQAAIDSALALFESGRDKWGKQVLVNYADTLLQAAPLTVSSRNAISPLELSVLPLPQHIRDLISVGSIMAAAGLDTTEILGSINTAFRAWAGEILATTEDPAVCEAVASYAGALVLPDIVEQARRQAKDLVTALIRDMMSAFDYCSATSEDVDLLYLALEKGVLYEIDYLEFDPLIHDKLNKAQRRLNGEQLPECSERLTQLSYAAWQMDPELYGIGVSGVGWHIRLMNPDWTDVLDDAVIGTSADATQPTSFMAGTNQTFTAAYSSTNGSTSASTTVQVNASGNDMVLSFDAMLDVAYTNRSARVLSTAGSASGNWMIGSWGPGSVPFVLDVDNQGTSSMTVDMSWNFDLSATLSLEVERQWLGGRVEASAVVQTYGICATCLVIQPRPNGMENHARAYLDSYWDGTGTHNETLADQMSFTVPPGKHQFQIMMSAMAVAEVYPCTVLCGGNDTGVNPASARAVGSVHISVSP